MDAYDVIIIGTGAGGGTLAHHLAPSGKKILLLERGDWLPRERAAAGPGADDDDVVRLHVRSPPSQSCAVSSGNMIRPAASISARCENACGKLPRCRPVSASNSSA